MPLAVITQSGDGYRTLGTIMNGHLAAVLKDVIPYYLDNDDIDGLAEDLTIYVSKLINTETPCKDMRIALSSDLLFLKETDG